MTKKSALLSKLNNAITKGVQKALNDEVAEKMALPRHVEPIRISGNVPSRKKKRLEALNGLREGERARLVDREVERRKRAQSAMQQLEKQCAEHIYPGFVKILEQNPELAETLSKEGFRINIRFGPSEISQGPSVELLKSGNAARVPLTLPKVKALVDLQKMNNEENA